MTDDMAFWDIIVNTGVTAKRLEEAPGDWDKVLAQLDYAPVRYTRNMIAHQTAYSSAKADVSHDLSMVLYHAGQPVGIWPLAMRKTQDTWVCESRGGEVFSPLFISGLGEKPCKVLATACLDALDSLCLATRQRLWRGTLSVGPSGANLWHQKVMAKGAKATVTHELFCDLSLPVETIRATLRKSYRALINKGARLWAVSVLDQVSHEVFREFQRLHADVAGRITRPQETWDIQEEGIHRGDAFLVTLRDNHGEMVGGGLFGLSPCEGLYAVGAYHRHLFDQPLGHAVQMRAIEHMKARGLRWYRIGDRPYPGDDPPPSEKELTIAHFAEGFATHMFLRLHTACPAPPEPERPFGTQPSDGESVCYANGSS